MEQAQYLADQGVRELILVAQETTVYGKDLYGEKSLHILLKNCAKFQEFSGFAFCIVTRRKSIRN